MKTDTINNRSPEVQAARDTMRRRGWNQVQVAKLLGVHVVHLRLVLTGRRESNRILSAISTLPQNPDPA